MASSQRPPTKGDREQILQRVSDQLEVGTAPGVVDSEQLVSEGPTPRTIEGALIGSNRCRTSSADRFLDLRTVVATCAASPSRSTQGSSPSACSRPERPLRRPDGG